MNSLILKRSIVIDGRKTSISLEDAFWSDLKEIAYAQQATLGALVARVDRTRHPGSNLSSAMRLFVLDWMRSGNPELRKIRNRRNQPHRLSV